MASAIPPQRHDVGAETEVVHRNEGGNDGDRKCHDRNERRPNMEQEEDDHQRDDDRLLDQGATQRADRLFDEPGPVIGWDDHDTGRERPFDLPQLRLDTANDVQRIFAVPHDDDAADHLTAAVELRDAPADVRAKSHVSDVRHPDRRASQIGAKGHLFDVGRRGQVAPPAHHVLPPRKLQEPALDVVVTRLDRSGHIAHGEIIRGQLVRVEVDLILLDEPADAGHFRHAWDARQPIPQIPVLEPPDVR